ncbi:5-formyltetrahydrofolate cyclo-ligase [Algoriphagus halophilus]|uniref:5-formyltetrahydrofolate cyclo-ligase n=1 Tax=Algoriphagus halophilus TaxID=226505 RepID=A0A1N6FLA2_9BACT|nr:5-formyltetrahydrofolate cyclo-ligase [Algoriphagus halophilus]SIN96034.1 5-formyltetrahydrofolate cyclo-ligase [Algoriphagus halophilus]
MSTEKEQIRQLFKDKRKALSPEEAQRRSELIFRQFQVWFNSHPEIAHIHIYLPIAHQNEINTLLIRDYLLGRGNSVYTSIVKSGTLQLDTVKIDSNTIFEINKWGIPIPQNISAISPNKIQLVLIPLLAFDIKGNRIGFGKGYYDVFLSGLDGEVLKVGLSFFDPVPQIPSETHDIPLDYCITSEKVFTF